MADDTTAPSYWLNWRFLLCALWVLIALIAAAILIIKNEMFNKMISSKKESQLDAQHIGILYEDETWKTSFKGLHPVWLLLYRLIAFGVMSALLIGNLIIDGAGILFFYTQWTFALVTFYFGLASSLSIYGCYKYWNEVGGDNINNANLDPEQGTYIAPSVTEDLNSHSTPINPRNLEEARVRKTAGICGYLFQIVFQTCSGAVGLTDTVFWFIIIPFLTPADYQLSFMDVSLHSVNAILLLVDIVLNRLRFPFFRLGYFGIWTSMFVIFQWIVHANVSMWWPYPFLDLSSPYAPVWYLGIGLILLPAYGIFALIVRGKQLLLLRFYDKNEHDLSAGAK